MHVEISVAYNFMLSYLYNKLPRRRVDTFGEELEKGIKKKFEGHWYPDKPFKGSAFRCIRFSGEKVDPVVIFAAASSGLDIDEIKSYLPADLCVWIDPCEVSYRIGEKGAVKILHSDKSDKNDEGSSSHLDKEIQAANKGFNPEAQSFKPIDSLSSSLSNLSISPSSPSSPGSWGGSPPLGGAGFNTSPQPFPPRAPANQTTMTTAMFAQTKFGSTKLKSTAKRPNRLPTADLRPRQMMAPGMFPGRPRSLSPRDQAAMEMALQHQQRMLALQQQQQQQQQFNGGLSPLSPMGDMYVPQQGFIEMSPIANGPQVNGLLSPADNSKAMLELAAMAYPHNFQHMLLAS